MVLPPPQPISSIAASLSIETCFSPQSVNLECRRFIPRRFHRPSQPVGFRNWLSRLLESHMMIFSLVNTTRRERQDHVSVSSDRRTFKHDNRAFDIGQKRCLTIIIGPWNSL